MSDSATDATPGTGAPTSQRTRPGRLAETVVELAPVALVVIAEAAWISVIGGLFQEFALRRTELGLPAIAGFVALGVVSGFVLGPRLGSRWPVAALALVVTSAAGGWFVSDQARAAIGSGIGPALAAHPGGFIAGLAVLRGIAHARLPLAEDTVTRLLGIGIPGLAVASLAGGLIAEPVRSAFLGETVTSAIVFVAAAALALAFARIDAVGQDGGFDWRRNPAWLLVTMLALIGAIAAAVPLATVAGAAISLLISVALGPLLVVGLVSGFDRRARRILLAFVLLAGLIVLLVRLFGGAPPLPSIPLGSGGGPDSAVTDQLMTISVSGLLLVAAIAGIVLLVALWMRRTAPPERSVTETRTIDPGGDPQPVARRRRRFGRPPAPRGAVEAYVALVHDLDRHPAVRREPGETPAAHAARLRASGAAGLGLDLLAADYALARYGGLAISQREDARGVARWRTLRRRLAEVRIRPSGAAGPDAAVPREETAMPEGRRTGVRAG